jgi:hypothetical protein
VTPVLVPDFPRAEARTCPHPTADMVLGTPSWLRPSVYCVACGRCQMKLSVFFTERSRAESRLLAMTGPWQFVDRAGTWR